MDDFVPEFHGIEDMYEIPTSSSGFTRHKKPAHGEEDIMELMWQNGQVVAQKPSKKSPFQSEEAAVKEIGSIEHLFMQEDEMASWLHYPPLDHDSSSFDHRDLYGSDLLYSNPPPTNPPVPVPPRPQNFGHFSRIPGRSTVVDSSNQTPAVVRPESRASDTAEVNNLDRKRKGTESDDKETQSQSEDIDFEAGETKKQARGSGSASTKRSRASQVHNLSERRRRDRINEKMKALQELIPRCNKVDKASMLDEAIEYLKSLQMQVQLIFYDLFLEMMSMGCGMIPMMYPGMHQYMPAMGMGMGMGMDMGLNRPMVSYPSMIPSSSIPNPAAAHMGHTFPMQAFQLPPLRAPDSSQIQASNQTYPTLNSFVANNPNQSRFPNFVDPYQQFHGLHQAHVPLPQNQAAMLQPSASAPSTSKETVNPENQQTG